MIRRTVLAAIALTLTGGLAVPALADSLSSAGQGNGPGICVLGTNHSNGTRDGICVWIPTN